MLLAFVQHLVHAVLPVALAATVAAAPAAPSDDSPTSLAEATNQMATRVPGMIDACLNYGTTGEQCWAFWKAGATPATINRCRELMVPINQCLLFAQVGSAEREKVQASAQNTQPVPRNLAWLTDIAQTFGGLVQPLILLVGALIAAWLKRHADQTADVRQKQLLLDTGNAVAGCAGRAAGLAKKRLDDLAQQHGTVTASDEAAAVSDGISYMMQSYGPEIQALGKDQDHLANMVRGELGRLPSPTAPATVEVKPAPRPTGAAAAAVAMPGSVPVYTVAEKPRPAP